MSSLGAYLRELRTRRNVSLEEVARATRVASRFLEALEADQASGLPAPAFTRGFIRAYCQFLGEPPDRALALYDGRAPRAEPARSGAARVTGAPAGTTAERSRSRGAVLVSFVLLVVLGTALFAVTLLLHPDRRGPARAPATAADPGRTDGTAAVLETPQTTPTAPATNRAPTTAASGGTPAASPAARTPAAATPPQAPSVAPSPASPSSAASAPGPRPTAPVASPTAAAVPPAPAVSALDLSSVVDVDSPYRLVARTSELTWLRVRTSDGRMTEENVPPGAVREFVSNQPFVITVGNAAGITLELNGRALPALGGRGAVVNGLVVPPARP